MFNIQTIQNVADCVPLYLPHSLYLKPVAKLNISVALPSIKTGKSISNLDIMDKLSAALKPDKFLVLKVSKSTVEFIRFEAELDERAHLRMAVSRLDGASLKLTSFNETIRVRASETKDEFPTRYDWDSYFRDASQMDEMKAGERPDTIHLTHLPIRWFCPRHAEQEDGVKPSENIFRRIFEKFGSVRCVDVPICDPYRSKMNADINGMKTFTFEQDVLFEAYVQFDEYVGFVRAMDEFRGMKLVRKFVDKTQAINITVTFDKTKHLSDAQQQRRERVRKRLISKAQAEEEELEQQKKLEKEKLEQQRKKDEELKQAELAKQREREEKRKLKHLKKIQERGQVEISQKIRVEERKLMIAQRKLESIRILEQLFDRIKLKNTKRHHTPSINNHVDAGALKFDLRDRLVAKYKSATEKLLNDQRQKVQDIKSKTPLSGLLGVNLKGSLDDEENEKMSVKAALPTAGSAANPTTIPLDPTALPLNPFKAAAAIAAVSSGGLAAAAYSSEAASEWMKSLSMLQYMPQMFAGMPPQMYRPPTQPNFPVSANYRGFAPRMRIRGRGRGRGRGGYDGASSYYHHYRHYNEDDFDDDGGGGGSGSGHYHKSSYVSHSRNRSRSRTRSRSRSRSRSYSRSRSHSHSRSRKRHYSKRSRSKSRSSSRSRSRRSRTHSKSRSRSRTRSASSSRSRTRSRSKRNAISSSDAPTATVGSGTSRSRDVVSSGGGKSRKTRSRSHIRSYTPPRASNKKLVSTRRSRSSDCSRSRSRSRHRSRGGKRQHSRHDRSPRRSNGPVSRRVVLETDVLVRSAKAIQRTLERDTKERMCENEREIRDNLRPRRKHTPPTPNAAAATIADNGKSRNADADAGKRRLGNNDDNEVNKVADDDDAASTPVGDRY